VRIAALLAAEQWWEGRVDWGGASPLERDSHCSGAGYSSSSIGRDLDAAGGGEGFCEILYAVLIVQPQAW
jgi:hypothetical protein